ncbi:hypothetical protein [Corynebacterium guangdongense]|uniref:Secreted protein n=1 Tax=Corynebacterium guangdongense TaxID=1783348 RepID=A0ABU1ZUH4_9CORY|nr:hypothetical protein [Corynebacterium guangdongense]MDR7328579.1 hypothetical protein [Corynebacterium guangdongense]WJZ17156.1 hypothetical protein CGUA_02800 [Corynebacterium guangdongense]
MKLNSTAKYVIAVIAVVWVILLAVMVALSAQRPGETVSGGLEKATAAFDDANLSASMVRAGDVYGDDFGAGLIVCPGVTEAEVGQGLGVDASSMGLDGGAVPEGTNYVLLVSQDGSTQADAISQDSVNLCTVPTNAIYPDMFIPLTKTADGGWELPAA